MRRTEKKKEGTSGGRWKALDMKKKVGAVVLAGAAAYGLLSLFFQYHYYPGTVVNGYKCGFHSVKKMKETIMESVDEYAITLKERDSNQETIRSSQIGLKFVDDGKLEALKADQKGYAWITFVTRDDQYEDGITLKVDEEAFAATVGNLNAFNEGMVVAPVDAWSDYNKEKNEYFIVEEIYGNTVKKDVFVETLKNAVLNQKAVMNLEEDGCYENPVYKKDSEEVLKANETLNKYVSTDIIYDFDDRQKELKGKTIHKWLSVTKNQKVKINEEKAAEYVKKLADKFDTVGIKRSFTSIVGNSVTVEGGTYGWKIDQEKETKKLIKLIKKGKQVTREPEYEHIAKSRKKFDIGDTYIEVDLGSQYMWLYKDGKTVVSTPVVTGNTSLGRGTPTGVYYILYKTTDYTLTGQGYASHVNYWLPFTHMGVGIHDASWRSSYGGSIFTYNGSHGCVNTPLSAVRTIYNNISSTYPVVVHW